MRELAADEVDQVVGGVNVAGAAIGVVVGGLFDTASYALQAEITGQAITFGGLAGSFAQGAISGALVGSGVGLITKALSGAKGLSAPGAALIGAGGAVRLAGDAHRAGSGGSEDD